MQRPPLSGMSGKRVVMTGATGGIGLAAAQRLTRMGARLTIIARSAPRASAAVRVLEADSPIDVLIGDLASQADVRRVAAEILERYQHIDVLINNAGAIYSSRELSVDGIELTWATNHLAPFLLTTLLLNRLKESAPSRIITTSSAAHYRSRIPFDDLNAERDYSGMGFVRYGQTKLANILFTVALAQRLEGTGVTANCFHPGFVATGFNHNNGLLMRVGMYIAQVFARKPGKAAETLVWLADSPDLTDVSGGYFVDKRQVRPSAAASDIEAATRLWELSEEQVRVSMRT